MGSSLTAAQNSEIIFGIRILEILVYTLPWKILLLEDYSWAYKRGVTHKQQDADVNCFV